MRDSKPMVDTNILVYAHNQDSPYFTQAKSLLVDLIDKGGFSISTLILFEFFAVITNGRKVETPLSSETALWVIDDMIESKNIDVLNVNDAYDFFQWLRDYIKTTKRYQIYDASIAYAMFQNEVTELYTNNTKDFKKFDVIKAINPFEPAAPSSTPYAPSAKRFIPYAHQSIDEHDVAAVCSVLRSDWLTTGPKVEEFEQSIAEYVGAKHAVAVSSGTAALHAAMFALGIGPGDEVIVPPMTFAGTANCILYQGGTPIFADIDPDTLLIDPEQVEAKITPRTKAIIAVEFAGQPCDWDVLHQIGKRHNLHLVDDACHALGAEYKGKKVGSLADMTISSFHPVKHITTGEGGMIVTDDQRLANRMRIFRTHGITRDPKFFISPPSALRPPPSDSSWFYEMLHLGYNYRISDIQCALGISQLRKLPGWLARRQEIAALYDQALEEIPGIKPLGLRSDVLTASQSALHSGLCAQRSTHAYHLYVVRIPDWRDRVLTELQQTGIAVNVHYIPVHLHPYYRERLATGPGLCPNAERAFKEIMSLPMYPGLSEDELERVLETLRRVVEPIDNSVNHVNPV